MVSVVDAQTLLRHAECSSARTNRDAVVDEMKRALVVIEMVVTDSCMLSSDVGKDDNSHSPPPAVNAADSGISLSQLQTTAFRAIKDFEVICLSATCVLVGQYDVT